MSMNQDELLKSVEALKSVTPTSLLPDVQKDINIASGLQAYNLEAGAKMIFPVMSPLRNMLPRINGKGKQVEYKAITGINTGNDQGWVAEGVNGNIVSTSFSDIFAVYRTLSQQDRVSFEQQWAGLDFIDSKATAVANLLRSVMITEEKAILFGQNTTAASNQQAPGTVGTTPVATLSQSATGGSIGASTVHVKIVARTGMGSALPSNDANVVIASGSTNSVTVQLPTISGQPILGFDVYAGTDGTNYYKVAASNVSGGVLGGVVGGSQMSSNGGAITLISVPTNGTNVTSLTVDNSANENAYNGLFAQIFGGNGATVTRVNGTLAATGSNSLAAHLLAMWNASYADPDVALVNATESTKITNLTLGAGTPYFVQVDNQNSATANYHVGRYTNPVTGTLVDLKVHPYIPQGTIATLSTKLPGWYVPSDIPAPMAIDAVQDYTEIDYVPTSTGGRYWPIEVMLYSTFKLYIPLLQGVMTGIVNG